MKYIIDHSLKNSVVRQIVTLDAKYSKVLNCRVTVFDCAIYSRLGMRPHIIVHLKVSAHVSGVITNHTQNTQTASPRASRIRLDLFLYPDAEGG